MRELPLAAFIFQHSVYFLEPQDHLETLENGYIEIKRNHVSTPSRGARGAQIFWGVYWDVYFAVLKYL